MPLLSKDDTRRLQRHYEEAVQALGQLRQESASVAGDRAADLRDSIDQTLEGLQSLTALAKERLEASPVSLRTLRHQAESLRDMTEGLLSQLDGELAGSLRKTVEGQLRQASKRAAEATGRTLDVAAQQAGIAREAAQTTLTAARERAASAADALARQQEETVPALVELAAQALGRATQAGTQARVQAGTQATALAQTLVKQKEEMVPAVGGVAAGTAAAVGGVLAATGRTVRATVWHAIWITVLGGLAIFLYAPRDEERAKLRAEVQEWLTYVVDVIMELRGGN